MSALDVFAAVGSAAALLVAWKLRWLSATGIAAAVVVGGSLWAGAGPAYLLLLLFFFASSSALSRSLGDRASGRRGRTAVQVLANGGVAAAAALAGLAGLLPSAEYAVAGALAAAMADTWATELGTAAGGPTRLISSGRLVTPGASGGVSWPGTAAGGTAATLLGLAAAAVTSGPSVAQWPLVTVVAGMLGMTVDSLLGATLEDRVPWVDNQVVNLFGTSAGAAAGWGVAAALGL